MIISAPHISKEQLEGSTLTIECMLEVHKDKKYYCSISTSAQFKFFAAKPADADNTAKEAYIGVLNKPEIMQAIQRDVNAAQPKCHTMAVIKNAVLETLRDYALHKFSEIGSKDPFALQQFTTYD